MTHRSARQGYRVLVAAPFGRDAQSLSELLDREGYDVNICRNTAELAAAIDEATGAALVTEEALFQNAEALGPALLGQAAWSEVPFIVLSAPRGGLRGVTVSPHLRLPSFLINAIVLERPIGAASLVSAIASALRARQKQFDMRDRLTDLSKAQAALHGLNDDLERQVRLRTVQLENTLSRLREQTAERERAEQQLRQSQKMEAIGQLTGGIAHDFNNMLTGVIGSLSMMKRRIDAGRLGDVDRLMDAATTSANRAASLTHRLLAFARRQSLDPKPVDVGELIGSLEDLLKRTIGERISLHVAADDSTPPALCDANQLESAVLNLVINARDAMPDGGALSVETKLADIAGTDIGSRPGVDPGRYVLVSISDTGVGMPAEILEKVFDPFFTTKPIGQGTGLGLSMVYGFAKQSNGHVRVHSVPGQGTTVSLYLPVAEALAAEPAPLEAPLSSSGRGELVLVVEDDPSVRLLIRELLDELGYVSLEADSAAPAIPLLASERPIRLMVSDVGLPDMNGRQLAEIARAHRPHLPILFVTGYAENAAIRSDFLGANMAMITKPFKLETLAARIAGMLHGPAH